MTQVGNDKALSGSPCLAEAMREETTLPSATSTMESFVAAMASGDDEETSAAAPTTSNANPANANVLLMLTLLSSSFLVLVSTILPSLFLP